MEKTIFEQMSGTYEQQSDYLIPCLTLPSEEENQPVSLWGQRYSYYLKQNHRVLYINLLTSGKLNSYLKTFTSLQNITQHNPAIAVNILGIAVHTNAQFFTFFVIADNATL